jgi:hypothetical protein
MESMTQSEETMKKCSHYDSDMKICRRGLYGANLTLSDCLSCSRYSGPPRGLGDKATNILRKTGVEKVVDFISKKKQSLLKKESDCGCGKRRKYLNEKFPAEHTDD